MEPAAGSPAAAGAPSPSPATPPASPAAVSRPTVARAASSMPAMLERGGFSTSSADSSSSSDDDSDALPDDQDGANDQVLSVVPVGLERHRRRQLRSAQSMDAFYHLPSLGATSGSQRRMRPLRGSLLINMAAESDPCMLVADESDSLSSLDELASSMGDGDSGEVTADGNERLQREDDPSDASVRVVIVQPVPDMTPSSALPSLASSSSSSSSTSSMLERLSTADREMITLMRRTELLRTSNSRVLASQRTPDHFPSLSSNRGADKSQTRVRRSYSGTIRAWLSRTVTQRTLHKLSAVRNSYFAFWLVMCSVAVVTCDLLAVFVIQFLYRPWYREKSFGVGEGVEGGSVEASRGHEFGDPQGNACGGELLLTMHLVGIPNVMLIAPVVFPSSALFQLYILRDRRMVRRPYLLLCELIVALQLGFMMFFAVRQVLNVPAIVRCHARALKHELIMFYSSLVVWLVLLQQIVVFARFLTHIKLQADRADDSAHTSSIGHSIVQVLLAHGFNPNELDKVARVNFNLSLIFKLCSRLLIETQDHRRSVLRALFCSVLLPPLHGAVAAGYVHVVRELIDHGADVNILPRASFYYRQAELPPIFVADDPQVLQLLVSRDANFLHVAAVALSGSTPRKRRMLATPLQQSAFTLRSDLSDFLIECGGDVALTPLHAAAARDDERAIAKLLAASRGTAVDSRGERVAGVFCRTPLHWAAIAGSLKAATALLDYGADPNARDRDGRTPLHWAARNNRPEIVSLLINRGANPNAVDSTIDELPVVCFAAEADGVSVHIFESLARAGASLHTQVAARGGDTALHIALQRENRQTALSLIKCGANIVTTNSMGKRAVDCTTSTELQFFLKRQAGSRKIMISYTHSHFQLAQRVREYLETREQLTCWLDTMDPSGIGGGAVWREEIARGISNCSLVLSLVSDGYARSEWCLKELALAKLLRKPVLGLIVDEGTGATMAPLKDLIPENNRVPFHDFITDRHEQENPRAVVFDIDDALFSNRWQVTRPLLVSIMKDGRRIEDDECVFAAAAPKLTVADVANAMGRGNGRRKMTVVQEEKSEDDEHNAEDSPSSKTLSLERRRRRSSGALTPAAYAARLLVNHRRRRHLQDEDEEQKFEERRVLLYSPVGEDSALLKRLRADLTRIGVVCELLDLATDNDEDVEQRLRDAQNVVFLIEAKSNAEPESEADADSGEILDTTTRRGKKAITRCTRKQVSDALQRVLRLATRVNSKQNQATKDATTASSQSKKVRVLPVIVQRNFLDLSKMYSLARSELYYFMDDGGVQWNRSAGALLARLQREQDAHRLGVKP